MARTKRGVYKTPVNFDDFVCMSEKSLKQLYAYTEEHLGHDEKGYLIFLGDEEKEDESDKVNRQGPQKSTFSIVLVLRTLRTSLEM